MRRLWNRKTGFATLAVLGSLIAAGLFHSCSTPQQAPHAFDPRISGVQQQTVATASAPGPQGVGSTHPTYTFGNLPAGANNGSVALVTDTYRGEYHRASSQWIQDNGKQFNVLDYGAVGDGTTDNTAAFQAAINDACAAQATVLVPPPAVQYAFNGSLTVAPQDGTNQVRCRILGMGKNQNWLYQGPSNTVFIALKGTADAVFENINISFANSVSGTVCWDAEITSFFTSSHANTFRKCWWNPGTGGSNIGWRMGQSDASGTFSDLTNWRWDQCIVAGQGSTLGDIGVQIGGSQAFPATFIGIDFTNIWHGIHSAPIFANLTSQVNMGDTTVNAPTIGFPSSGSIQIDSGGAGEVITYTGVNGSAFTGCSAATKVHTVGAAVDQYVTVPYVQGVYPGTQGLTIFGGHTSHMATDIVLNGQGRNTIIGYRGENGQRYLQVGTGNSGTYRQVHLIDCEIGGYTAPSDGVIKLYGNTVLAMDSCHVAGGATITGTQFINQADSGATLGGIVVRGGDYNVTDPMYTLSVSSLPVWIDPTVQRISGSPVVARMAQPPRFYTTQTLSYSPSITPNPAQGEYMIVPVTDNVNFTINAPTTSKNGTITVEIDNNSGGVMGSITWNATYVLGTAFASPASNGKASISFSWNGTNWIEVARQSQPAGTPVNLGSANTWTTGPQIVQTGGDAISGWVAKGNSGTQTASLIQVQTSGGTVNGGWSQNGELGLGQDFVSGRLLSITSAPTATSGSLYASSISHSANPGGASSGAYFAQNMQTNAPATQNITGTLGGLQAAVGNNGTGTVAIGSAVVAQINASNAAGTISTGYAFRALPPALTGHITTNHGMQVNNMGGANVTTSYGVKIEAQSGSTNTWGLYSAGANSSFVATDTGGHVVSGGTAPGIAAGTGAGTLPTVSISGTDLRGTITITTGTGPAASATVATITFNNAFAAVPGAVIITPAEPNAAALTGNAAVWEDVASRLAASFVLKVGSGGLQATTTYKFSYWIIG